MSAGLFDAIAEGYDALFEAPHRAAYDRLAWERVRVLLPDRRGLVIDVGCGTGRWLGRLTALGHEVVGIEPSAAMAAIARSRAAPGVRIVEQPVERAECPPACADLVIAMGSLQYADDPEAAVCRAAVWLRPGGHLSVLVDSRMALALELVQAGRAAEAVERLRTGTGTWRVNGHAARMHLLGSARLEAAFRAAGLDTVAVEGLIVGATAHGRDAFAERLRRWPRRQLAIERTLAATPWLADAGKHLLATGRRPA